MGKRGTSGYFFGDRIENGPIFSDAASQVIPDQNLRDLDGVQRRAFAQVVGDNPETDPVQ
jgi:hypothetical protein